MREFRNLLVTGGCGFIGSNFIRYVFRNTNFAGRIVNLDALTYAGNLKSLEDIEALYKGRYIFEHADIRNKTDIARIFNAYDIDSVCHFAAESHVDRSIVSPDDFIQTNIVGTFNLLQAARERLDRTVLFHHVSTDEVFGSLGEEGCFTEDTPYSPRSPYSASKASSDHLVRAYHETYGLPVTISNCSNNYGPYQFPEKLFPLMILNAFEGKPLPVYGEGLNVRDWLYVEDHCSAIWAIMSNAKLGDTYTVGGRCEMKNIDVVKKICSIVDQLSEPLKCGKARESLITFVKDRPGHDHRYAIDCLRLEQGLKWQQKETAESGFYKTVKWYIENQDWVNSVRTGAYRDWVSENYGNR